jgi:hypothetical protein
MTRRRKRKTRARKHKRLFSIREDRLRPIIREAARAGLVEAIEHTANFWSVSDGYKKYIDHQVAIQAEALMAAVRSALRQDRDRRRNKQVK